MNEAILRNMTAKEVAANIDSIPDELLRQAVNIIINAEFEPGDPQDDCYKELERKYEELARWAEECPI